MAFTAYATNTKINQLTLYFRPPEGTQLLQVQIYPRALNQPIVFANEDFFNAFKEQNKTFIDNRSLIINSSSAKVKEKEAVKINEQNATQEHNEVKKKKDKAVKDIEDSVKSKNTSLKVTVDKAEA